MLSLWLSLTDSWDAALTDPHIIVATNLQVERSIEWDTGLYHAFGTDCVTRGHCKTWHVQITRQDAKLRQPYVQVGIMPQQTKFNSKIRRIEGFCQNDGYCLYTASGKKYHDGITGESFPYGERHAFKVGDVISMQLELTQKANQTKNCGVLKFIINGQYEADEMMHIAFDTIDINQRW
eukprot:CAMPEP_0202694620 /NCGR_PEP_ID=MMETSP1385-20130828/8436_1 /ASSEMBLY_ACC=CAM_ASM_000861 /TAXON_ID=933848 /ORGANISM="Elphidium margaritaceum" /LENGTH=178 /DNA_ID=CAMNT_0049350499 /DNA_START=125 /DNA_END=658 /DNA_ORIENTATION=-